jgi:hypothetical protein
MAKKLGRWGKVGDGEVEVEVEEGEVWITLMFLYLLFAICYLLFAICYLVISHGDGDDDVRSTYVQLAIIHMNPEKDAGFWHVNHRLSNRLPTTRTQLKLAFALPKGIVPLGAVCCATQPASWCLGRGCSQTHAD